MVQKQMFMGGQVHSNQVYQSEHKTNFWYFYTFYFWKSEDPNGYGEVKSAKAFFHVSIYNHECQSQNMFIP